MQYGPCGSRRMELASYGDVACSAQSTVLHRASPSIPIRRPAGPRCTKACQGHIDGGHASVQRVAVWPREPRLGVAAMMGW